MINITIKTDNAAFDEGNFGYEVARILQNIAKDFEQDSVKSGYADINGNRVARVD